MRYLQLYLTGNFKNSFPNLGRNLEGSGNESSKETTPGESLAPTFPMLLF